MNVDFLYNTIGYRLEPLVAYLNNAEYDEASLETRSHFIEYAWINAQDSLIFGHGLDCFRLLPGAWGTYSHCNFLELLYSTGWIGLFIYYSTSISTVLKFYKYINDKYTGLLLALLIPFLVCDYMNVTYSNRTAIIIPSLAIMFVGRKKENVSA